MQVAYKAALALLIEVRERLSFLAPLRKAEKAGIQIRVKVEDGSTLPLNSPKLKQRPAMSAHRRRSSEEDSNFSSFDVGSDSVLMSSRPAKSPESVCKSLLRSHVPLLLSSSAALLQLLL